MAVSTEIMLDAIPKIAFFMTPAAGEIHMIPNQAKLCEAMIKILPGAIILPAAGVVTRHASVIDPQILEGAAMRIIVTAIASSETQPFEEKSFLTGSGFRRWILTLHFRDADRLGRDMTFPARNLLMKAR